MFFMWYSHAHLCQSRNSDITIKDDFIKEFRRQRGRGMYGFVIKRGGIIDIYNKQGLQKEQH